MEVAEVFDWADLEVVIDPEPKGHPNETFGTTCLTSVLQLLIMLDIEGTVSLLQTWLK